MRHCLLGTAVVAMIVLSLLTGAAGAAAEPTGVSQTLTVVVPPHEVPPPAPQERPTALAGTLPRTGFDGALAALGALGLLLVAAGVVLERLSARHRSVATASSSAVRQRGHRPVA